MLGKDSPGKEKEMESEENMNVSSFLQQTLQNEVLRWFFYGPLLLIVLDVLTGIGAAVSRKQFIWQRLGDFLDTDLLKYFLVCVVVAIVYLAGGIAQATTVATLFGMGALAVHITASIGSNLGDIFGEGTRANALVEPIAKQAESLPQSVTEKVPAVSEQPTVKTPVMKPAISLASQKTPGILPASASGKKPSGFQQILSGGTLSTADGKTLDAVPGSVKIQVQAPLPGTASVPPPSVYQFPDRI